MRNRIRDRKWYPYAVAACIAVAFYVLLVHLGSITAGLMKFLSYFRPIFYGCVIAYVMNPLAKWLQQKVFYGMKQDKPRWYLSIGATVILLLALIGFLLRILIPQLANSIGMLIGNMDTYLESLQAFATKWFGADRLGINEIFDSSGDMVKRLQLYLADNAGRFVNASAEAGRSVVMWIISFVLSIYILTYKESIIRELSRFGALIMPENRYHAVSRFLIRCDKILVRYITFSLADAAIIGIINALFMFITRMEYVGLISVVVGVTNLVPTFGPIIGAIIGGIILLLVNPVHALIFILFTIVLQFADPYFIKPRLFGNTLGVSGLLILVSVIICGNILGVFGLLISIPLAAIVDFAYKEGVPAVIKRRKEEKWPEVKKDRETEAETDTDTDTDTDDIDI